MGTSQIQHPEVHGSRRQVITYLLLVFAFSSVFYFLILRAHRLGAGGGLYVLGIMWCPALAGATALKLNGRKLSELGWKWPQAKYALMSWYIPLMYAAIAYAVVWSSGLGGFPNHEFMQHMVPRMGLHASPLISTLVYVALAGSFGMIEGLATALGEEIGWRGFLVPELFKTVGFTGTAFISGVVWACWHYPILIWGDYNAGTPIWVVPQFEIS
jgi:membrane protease YdiL (CAAX protease family)